jgi:hypothetical protein
MDHMKHMCQPVYLEESMSDEKINLEVKTPTSGGDQNDNSAPLEEVIDLRARRCVA